MVVEGLVMAIRSLSHEDKMRLMRQLLEDPDTMDAMGNVIIDRLFGKRQGAVTPVISRAVSRSGGTSKESAREARAEYVARLKEGGTAIDQVSNAWARTKAGLWVALPLATERRPNHWLLGVSEDELRRRLKEGPVALVLLCETTGGALLDFVVPAPKVGEIFGSLSRSRGQLKLNLKKVGSSYYLVIPGRPVVNVTDYQGRTQSLAGPA